MILRKKIYRNLLHQLLTSIFCLGFLFMPYRYAYAQTLTCDPAQDPPALSDIACPIEAAINYLLIAVGFAFIIMLLYGSLKFALSEGDSKAIEAAKKTLTWGFIGFFAVLAAVSIINISIRIFVGNKKVDTLQRLIESITNFLSVHSDLFRP
jgi:hypothetical protein